MLSKGASHDVCPPKLCWAGSSAYWSPVFNCRSGAAWAVPRGPMCQGVSLTASDSPLREEKPAHSLVSADTLMLMWCSCAICTFWAVDTCILAMVPHRYSHPSLKHPFLPHLGSLLLFSSLASLYRLCPLSKEEISLRVMQAGGWCLWAGTFFWALYLHSGISVSVLPLPLQGTNPKTGLPRYCLAPSAVDTGSWVRQNCLLTSW